jgi:uncharacterized protein (TIGR02145 family)
MKKLLFFIFVCFALGANAQTYQISFAGSGASNTVGSIIVENLKTGAIVNLNGGDILRLNLTTGINSDVYGMSSDLMVFPNPSAGSVKIQFTPPAPGNAVISLYDLTGRQVARVNHFLENYLQEFQLSGLGNGLHLISVKGNTYNYSAKILSNSNVSENTISLERISNNSPINPKPSNDEDKGSTATVDMQYTAGNRLKFTGRSGDYSTVFVDDPTQTKTITFNFVPCTDFEKNNYSVVQIGTQLYMAENLKSTKYNDGTTIPLVADSLQWLGLSTPGYCFYRNNEAAYKNVYGALYNFYAASNSKLCPDGWHVPIREEYVTLHDFLGGYWKAGAKMKETGLAHWYMPNYGATNESGFTGLPGGWRGSTSKYQEIHATGEFWSSTSKTDEVGHGFWLDYWTTMGKYFYEEFVNKKVGFSIRCMKD